MSSTPIAYIDVRFSVHATEDLDKVAEAVNYTLPADYLEDVTFERKDLRGHYGNPITLFETRIKKKKVVQAVAQHILSDLSEEDRESLLTEIDLHVEEGSLYLRLDKQAALGSELRLCVADPIRVRIRFRSKNMEEIAKICQELGRSP
ncbi:hypothetical protein GWN63_03340 [Candidatus Bathyarchaeota archaeon]|nr:hypothetical protein [Desulfobacterales bacterium]NIU81263.1 hypothetical protein [Candidatus Bathyarchaeota archaeon]NIV67907.1 hypothetical protein [Candidatus Bathyarchaeota archaeon]NIW16352.1 hypothetical protein [Candidatus Bathyarchaeota archaeon]NIW34490.1 hypothetical protein [Candidatus Bathyarchaeota archaeon]